MAGRIRREDVDLVRERTRIDEVVGEQVALKSAGSGSLKGLCPFHDERSPSFHVRPAVGMYHCFGCGKGGDVFSFLQEIDAVTFVEAVELLAARAGVTLRYEEGGAPRPGADPGRRARLLDAHRVAADFYAEQLSSPAAGAGRTFLAERGFDRAAAERFSIGFAPTGWGSLTDHLRGRGFTTDELITAGLAARGQRGPYDRFRGRLVWPIRDTTGATIGFGARRLFEDDSGPKYLNTPDTPLYRKSSVLYGIDLAKREIAKAKQVVVVEGYTDVMAAHLSGVGTAVATCGTAFAAEHVALVRRVMGDDARGGEVVFTFDGDAAGRTAALRAFEEDQRFVAQTFVAVEASGLDPCDLRQARGEEAVRELVASRRPLVEFVIRSVLAELDLSTAEGRVRALAETVPLVAKIKDPSLRPEYARSLAGWLGMDVERVLAAVRTAGRTSGWTVGQTAGHTAGPTAGPAAGRETGREGSFGTRSPDRPSPATGRRAPSAARDGGVDPVLDAERQLLAIVVQAPASVPADFDALDGEAFVAPVARAVHDVVRTAGGVAAGTAGGTAVGTAGGRSSWAERLVEAAGDVIAPVVRQLAVMEVRASGEEGLSRLAAGLLSGVRERDLLRREADLRGQAQRLEGSGDAAAAAAAWAQVYALAARRQELRGA